MENSKSVRKEDYWHASKLGSRSRLRTGMSSRDTMRLANETIIEYPHKEQRQPIAQTGCLYILMPDIEQPGLYIFSEPRLPKFVKILKIIRL